MRSLTPLSSSSWRQLQDDTLPSPGPTAVRNGVASSSTALSSTARIERAIDALPRSAGRLPSPCDLRSVLDGGVVAHTALIARLAEPLPDRAEHARAIHSGWMILLAGEARRREGLPVLLRHLGAPHAYAEEELVHTLTRIGSHAITGLLLLLFDQRGALLARVRAARALSGIALAAREHGSHPRWEGDGARQVSEIAAALMQVLSGVRPQPPAVVRAAAQALCDMRWQPAREAIDELFRCGVLVDEDGFTREILSLTMSGDLIDVELGAWDVSLISWLL